MFGRNLKLTLALVLTGAVTVVAMACGSSTNETAPADDLTAVIEVDGAVSETSDVTHEDEADVLEVTLSVIEGRNWGFDPPLIEIPVGQHVRLTLVNDGRVEHDVEIPALVPERIEAAGEEDGQLSGEHQAEDVVAAHTLPRTESSVLFTATKAGKFEFTCTILGHKEAGMVGTIVVANNA